MSLETVYEMAQGEIGARIDAIIDAVADFAKANAGRSLWLEDAGECVYVCSYLGDLERGDRIPCARMGEIVREWLRRLSEHVEEMSDVFDGAARIEVRCPDGMRGLALSCLKPSGEAVEQLAFTRACGISEKLQDE